VEAVSEQLLPINPLYFLIVATYGLTLLYALGLRFLRVRRPLIHAQFIGDLLIITGLVYFTGATKSGFLLLYPLSVLSGSVLLYRRQGLALAGLASGFYAALLWGVRSGLLPPQGLGETLYMSEKALMYSVLVTGVACVTVAMIGSYLSESLRSAGVEMADLRELNQVILASIQSGLLMADSSGNVLYVNRVGEGILGRLASQLRGQPVDAVFGSLLLGAPALEARSQDRRLSRMNLPYTRPDGSIAELGLSVASLAVSEPRSRGYLLVFQDLTEIRVLEREVRLKEKLAAVGEMAAQLAHEIRNPLGSISGSAQVLMAEPNMSPEQEHLLGIITKESKRLSQALNQFLFQARPARRPAGPVDIRPLISEAVTLLRNGPEVRPAHRVEFQADHGPHLCLADPDGITQVFWNLARNGLEAMPEGGLLSVRLGRTGNEIVLGVRDEGRGMDRGDTDALFEPFHGGSPMGTGLGLAIVYAIVREHKGDITIRSVPYRGTNVEVRLPLLPVTAFEPVNGPRS
jgi:two-component system sensor histidine kinase PilS (NtrC family)